MSAILLNHELGKATYREETACRSLPRGHPVPPVNGHHEVELEMLRPCKRA